MSSELSSMPSSHSFGVVEGFYWGEKHAYKNQYGEYTHIQRRKLIQFMAEKGLNVYVYDPKVVVGKPEGRIQRSITLLEGNDLHEWKETCKLAKELKIDFLWGLTPSDLSYMPSDKLDENRSKLESVIEQVTSPSVEAAGVVLLWDDVPGAGNTMAQQAKLVQELHTKFPSKIKACCPPYYKGKPEEFQQKLESYQGIPKAIPFVFTGPEIWNSRLQASDMPFFSDRKIVVWDNWIASDRLRLANFCPLPPLGRDKQLLTKVAGYWLNLNFPLERALPVIATLPFLKENGSPELLALTAFLTDTGGIADDWAKEIGVSKEFTRAVLRVKIDNRDAYINPCPKNIVETHDLHSLNLLLTKGALDINAPLVQGKTWMQLAVEGNNFPVAKFLKTRGAHDKGVDWITLEINWKKNHVVPALKPLKLIRFLVKQNARLDPMVWRKEKEGRLKECLQKHTSPIALKAHEEKELNWEIISCVETYNLRALQNLLQWGLSAETTNSYGKTLSVIAQNAKYSDLAVYLDTLEELEKIKRKGK